MREVVVATCIALAAFGLPLSSSAQELLTATFETVIGTGPVPAGNVTLQLTPFPGAKGVARDIAGA